MYIKSDAFETEQIKSEFSKISEELSQYIDVNVDCKSTVLGNKRAKSSIEFEEDMSKSIADIISGFSMKIDKTNKEFDNVDEKIGGSIRGIGSIND